MWLVSLVKLLKMMALSQMLIDCVLDWQMMRVVCMVVVVNSVVRLMVLDVMALGNVVHVWNQLIKVLQVLMVLLYVLLVVVWMHVVLQDWVFVVLVPLVIVLESFQRLQIQVMRERMLISFNMMHWHILMV